MSTPRGFLRATPSHNQPLPHEMVQFQLANSSHPSQVHQADASHTIGNLLYREIVSVFSGTMLQVAAAGGARWKPEQTGDDKPGPAGCNATVIRRSWQSADVASDFRPDRFTVLSLANHKLNNTNRSHAQLVCCVWFCSLTGM